MLDMKNPDGSIRETPMPSEMHLLLNEYPRDAWEAHPNFKQATQNWLGAHQGFRQLSQIVRADVEKYIDRNRGPEDFADRLGYYGDIMVRNLHGHHSWEDRSYFPELSAADPRFDRGLEILESDHRVLDQTLDRFVDAANGVIKLIQLDEMKARESAAPLLDAAADIGALLERHLADEEDLAVPIILHYKLRG